jgi:hypothetical protein
MLPKYNFNQKIRILVFKLLNKAIKKANNMIWIKENKKKLINLIKIFWLNYWISYVVGKDKIEFQYFIFIFI